MSRRKKKGNSIYLDPEMEEINKAAAVFDAQAQYRCTWKDCFGMGPKGGTCDECGSMIPNYGRDNMAIVFPETARHKQKYHGNQGSFYGGEQVWYDSHNHKGEKIVYESDKKQLFAASSGGLEPSSGKWDLIIDLANNVKTPIPFIKPLSTSRFQDLKKYVYSSSPVKSDVLQLDWPDQAVPPVGLDFWLKLWDMLPPKTVVACMGGHGRTGTCLVALMIASGLDYYTALSQARSEHCNNAVENTNQEKYLHALYMNFLERLIKVETDPKVLKSLQEDLDFCKDHVPSFPVQKSSKDNGSSHKGADWQGQNCKQENGILYFKICDDKKCTLKNCAIKAHQRWVPHQTAVGKH